MVRYVNAVRSISKWGLHPLIHTLLEFNLAQDIEIISKRSIDVQRVGRLSPVASGRAIVMDSPTSCILDAGE